MLICPTQLSADVVTLSRMMDVVLIYHSDQLFKEWAVRHICFKINVIFVQMQVFLFISIKDLLLYDIQAVRENNTHSQVRNKIPYSVFMFLNDSISPFSRRKMQINQGYSSCKTL